MDQEKIGKFILKCRKEKNITQQELALKLGVTDKAISKWENGRCLMDISLLMPLSEILNVTVMEIINGERINKDDICDRSDKFAVDTLNYMKYKIKISRIKSILIFILVFVSIFMFGYFVYQGVNLFKYNIKFTSNHKEILNGLSNNEVIKIYKKTLEEDKYLSEGDIKIRNDFKNYVRSNNDDMNKSVKYTLYDDSGSILSNVVIGYGQQYISLFSYDEMSIYGIYDIGDFDTVDRKYFLLKNDINNDVDFIKYINNNGYLKNSLFSKIYNMRENYSVNLFTQIAFPVVDKITFIEGDYLGYIYDIGRVRNVNIIKNNITYSLMFKGDEYFNNEYLYELISTIEIK